MKTKIHLYQIASCFLLFFAFGFCQSGFAQNNLLQTLQEKDQAFASSFSARVNYEYPTAYFDYSQGNTISNMQLSSNGSSKAYLCENSFSKEFSYRNKGTRGYQDGDWGLEEELFLWRTHKKIGFSDATLNQSFRLDEMVTIEKEGTVIPSESYPMQLKFPTHNPNNLVEYDHVLMALGRGFARHLNEQKSVETLPSGMVRGTFSGFYGFNQPGTWVLWVDPAKDFLVAGGTFTPLFSTEVTITVNPDGIQNGVNARRSGGKLLGEEGQIIFSMVGKYTYTVKASLENLSGSPNSGLHTQARSSVVKLPDGGEILDYTSGTLVRFDM